MDLLPLVSGTEEHLGTYAAMDVSLDPFPYAGTTTTCESLYMGAPPSPLPPHARGPCALCPPLLPCVYPLAWLQECDGRELVQRRP